MSIICTHRMHHTAFRVDLNNIIFFKLSILWIFWEIPYKPSSHSILNVYISSVFVWYIINGNIFIIGNRFMFISGMIWQYEIELTRTCKY